MIELWRGVEQWQLVGLITRRSQVRILPPLLKKYQDGYEGQRHFCGYLWPSRFWSAITAHGFVATIIMVLRRADSNYGGESMQYRSLGRTGVQVSPLCLGCMNFGNPTPEAEALEMIDYALENGINFLDTANVYNLGLSEEVVGRALKRNGKRSRVVLATKVHGVMDDTDVLAAGNNRRHIIEQCDASLKRLQTDYIDLYQIHRPDSQIPIDETLRALDDLIRAGKVRYIGTSTFPAWQGMESLWVSRAVGLNRFVTEQPPYHLLDRSIERELIPLAQTYGLAILPWAPLARGFLTGKYPRRVSLPDDYRAARDMQVSGGIAERTKLQFGDAAYAVLDTVEALA